MGSLWYCFVSIVSTVYKDNLIWSSGCVDYEDNFTCVQLEVPGLKIDSDYQ